MLPESHCRCTWTVCSEQCTPWKHWACRRWSIILSNARPVIISHCMLRKYLRCVYTDRVAYTYQPKRTRKHAKHVTNHRQEMIVSLEFIRTDHPRSTLQPKTYPSDLIPGHCWPHRLATLFTLPTAPPEGRWLCSLSVFGFRGFGSALKLPKRG